MEQNEIQDLIKNYEDQLAKLQPTLHPRGNIPFTKVGLLNTARLKEKKFNQNLMMLKVIKQSGKNITRDDLNELLK